MKGETGPIGPPGKDGSKGEGGISTDTLSLIIYLKLEN